MSISCKCRSPLWCLRSKVRRQESYVSYLYISLSVTVINLSGSAENHDYCWLLIFWRAGELQGDDSASCLQQPAGVLEGTHHAFPLSCRRLLVECRCASTQALHSRLNEDIVEAVLNFCVGEARITDKLPELKMSSFGPYAGAKTLSINCAINCTLLKAVQFLNFVDSWLVHAGQGSRWASKVICLFKCLKNLMVELTALSSRTDRANALFKVLCFTW